MDPLSKGAAGLVLAVAVAYVLGFTLWTLLISFTSSTLLPDYTLVGLRNYQRLVGTRLWQIANVNLAIYGVCFVALSTALGLLLAVLVDQKVRAETLFRTIYLYPIALSFVVTGRCGPGS